MMGLQMLNLEIAGVNSFALNRFVLVFFDICNVLTGLLHRLADGNRIFSQAQHTMKVKDPVQDHHTKKTENYFAHLNYLVLAIFMLTGPETVLSQKIDRKAMVSRHNLHLTKSDLRGPTQVGNGHFAFGFDATGLQTFNNDANTLSDWGWHKFPVPGGKDPYQYKGSEWNTQNRTIRYDVHNEKEHDLYHWMRVNPQRLNLGRLKFIFKSDDGKLLTLNDIKSPVQDLDLWTGISVSNYEVAGKKVEVTTICHPEEDAITVKVNAPKLNDGKIIIQLEFPYASNEEFSNAGDWRYPNKHVTTATIGKDKAVFQRKLDSTRFDVLLEWKGGGKLERKDMHTYMLSPTGASSMEVALGFRAPGKALQLPTFAITRQASIKKWKAFWNTGGAIDLSQSKDPRWKELERRIVLSQYLMEVNEAGQLPPQESGLVNNGWYGKYHMEMLWWHAAHYALWGRMLKMDGLTSIYRSDVNLYLPQTKAQGYDGVRWPKTLGDRERWEWPNETNPLLIWQQPHPIFFAELEYRSNPTQATIDKWKDIVTKTADFMASYPVYNRREDRYILGYPLQVVSENADQRSTINPVFELSYWRTGLRLAQEWRKRSGLPEDKKYQDVLAKLSELPQKDGLYESWENIHKMWTVYNFEHPALIGAYGMLPGDGVNVKTMDQTLAKVEKTWKFEHTWGWDFPMLAMTAARLGHPDKALSYLLDYPSFTWDEHGLSGGGVAPYPYFPSNGGLLYAVAMMAAGWDGSNGTAPGFPKDGSWIVKYEGLKPAL
ncbi:MAG: hypothetical protein EOO89_05245 [Pedobacter sp.]|nr:MAG: hypothetical protein EOO89_05245 [Pedobacter sp.]